MWSYGVRPDSKYGVEPSCGRTGASQFRIEDVRLASRHIPTHASLQRAPEVDQAQMTQVIVSKSYCPDRPGKGMVVIRPCSDFIGKVVAAALLFPRLRKQGLVRTTI